MAVKLNLLPQGAGITGELGKTLKLTRMLGVIAVAFFLVFTIGISAFFVLSTLTLKNLNSDLDSLKSQISTQEATEQKVVLLKDRLAKIKTALATPGALKNFDTVIPYVSGLGAGSTISTLDVSPEKVTLSLVFTTRAGVSDFTSSLSTSKNFSSAVLTSFVFNPAAGYQVNVNLTAK